MLCADLFLYNHMINFSHVSSQRQKDEWSGKNIDLRTSDRTQYLAAPSAGKGILAEYERLIDTARQGKESFDAVVFGATPELRDMVLDRGGNLTTVDFSAESFEKCGAAMEHVGDPREHIKVESWLETTCGDASADIVLGDGIFNNIPFDSYERLFGQIHRILRPDGFLFSARACCHLIGPPVP